MSAISSCPECHTTIPANFPVGYLGRCQGCMKYEDCIVLHHVVPEGSLEWHYRREQELPAGHVGVPYWTPTRTSVDNAPAVSKDATPPVQETGNVLGLSSEVWQVRFEKGNES